MRNRTRRHRQRAHNKISSPLVLNTSKGIPPHVRGEPVRISSMQSPRLWYLEGGAPPLNPPAWQAEAGRTLGLTDRHKENRQWITPLNGETHSSCT